MIYLLSQEAQEVVCCDSVQEKYRVAGLYWALLNVRWKYLILLAGVDFLFFILLHHKLEYTAEYLRVLLKASI